MMDSTTSPTVAAPPSPPLASPRRGNVGEIVVVALLALAPFAMRGGIGLTVLSEAMVYAIAAMSLDLLMGFTGLASFGHAAFFGLGAYTAGLIGVHYTALLPVTLLAAAGVGALAALAGGFLAIRSAGIYFIFLTLALAQVVYAIAFKWRALTGGDDGLSGVPRPSLGPLDAWVHTDDNAMFYGLVAVLFVLSYLGLKRIVGSSFGSVLVGIRENAVRMSALGYRVQLYKLAAFGLAGAFAGLAGGLFAHLFQLVSPEQLNWQTSALFLVMVVLGGSGSLVGPMIGALVIVLLQNVVSTYTERWPSIMAILFIGVVMFARGGVWGLLRRTTTPRSER